MVDVAAVEIDVLGPLRVRVGGHDVAVDGPRRIRLLGCLVLHRDRWCSADRLAVAVWGDEAPTRSRATLHSHVAHLRRLLTAAGAPVSVLESGDAGYRLVTGAALTVDVDRFESLIEAASVSAPIEAMHPLDAALALWRGVPFDGALDPGAPAETTRLEELHEGVVDARLEALLRVGDAASAVADAERAVTTSPLRERRWELLMLALYRTSRQADALRAFERARLELGHSGLMPSPSLREMERRVIAHDQTLLRPEPFGTRSDARSGPESVTASHPPDITTVAVPPIRFARASGVSIGYQTWGSGPWLVATPPLAQNIEMAWESPHWRRMFDRVGSRTTFVHFDKRGTGVSDRSADMSIEQRMDDFRAVMDACQIDSAVLCGVSEGGPLAIAFAAAHPERVRGLVLYGTFARVVVADDYPIGVDPQHYRATTRAWERSWGTTRCPVIDQFMPSLADDLEFREWAARYMRQSCSPGTLEAIDIANRTIDVRPLLGGLDVPTLVLHRTGDQVAPPSWGRYLAERIPGARYLEFEGRDHLPWIGPNWVDIIDASLDFVCEVTG